MNETHENPILFIRLLFIAISSSLIIVPQILWNLLGYEGIILIILESLFIVAGFFSLLLGLINPLPRFLYNYAVKVWKTFEASSRSTKIRKFLPFGILSYGIYLLVPFFLSGIQRFNSYPTYLEILLIILTLFLLSGIAAIHFREVKKENDKTKWYYIPIAGLTIVWAIAFWYGSPRYPTDEMLLNLYSSHLFLEGINPYISSNTAGVFSYFHSSLPGYPLSIGTPLLTGGLVTNLSYPAIAFFSYLPAQFIGIPPTLTLLPLFALPPVIIFLTHSKIKNRTLALMPVFILLLDPGYLLQTALGYPDIVWVALFILSLYLYKKPAVSGFTMGLAMAVKQIPWLAFPFFFIFIYRESGRKKAFLWLILAVAGFLLPNISFIIQSPVMFFNSILSPAIDPIMGVGFGPSQLAFLGILSLTKEFFTIMILSLVVSFIVLYIFYYDRLKYAFIAFPLIIFLFNYRFLSDYVVFWPFIALIIPAIMMYDEKKSEKPDKTSISFPIKKRVIAIILTLILVGVPLAFHEAHQQSGSISISGLSVVSTNSKNITSISLDLGISGKNFSYNQLMYRIIPWGPVPNLNGYLWHHANVSMENNGARITILPDNSLQQIPFNGKYRIIAYYGTTSSTQSFVVHNGKIS